MYTHEFIYKTWYEDPTPAYEAVRGYVASDYDFNAEYKACMDSQQAAIQDLYAKVSDPEQLAQLKHYLELSVKMAPITPDHHFYIDQGIYSRLRVAFVQIGKALVRAGILDDPEDIFMLKYDEIRCTATSNYCPGTGQEPPGRDGRRPQAPSPGVVRHCHRVVGLSGALQVPVGLSPEVRSRDEGKGRETEISKTVLKGIPGCPGVQEGIAHLVSDPSELDTVKEGEILVCKMTNPAWVVSFSKISALVTDTGGALSHPAVVARESASPVW